jgi:DUF2971 family protein
MRRASASVIKKLYHYEPFNESYLADTLTNNQVHLSDPSHFNDPWDCCPMFSGAGMDQPSCQESWSRFFGLMTDTLPEINKKVVEEGSLLRDPRFLTRSIQNLNRHSREITLQRWRIYCLTPQPDSTLMWAHYAERHKGICLEFNAEDSRFGGAFEVMYAEKRPVIDCRSLANATEMAEKMVLMKSSDWAYEHEFRILARAGEFDQEPAHSLPKTTGDFLELPAGALTGIIIGCKADMNTVATINHVVRDCQPSVKIRQAVQCDLRYRVTIEPTAI